MAYYRTIYSVPDKSEWIVPDHIKELQIIPPKKLTRKGRKKVNRNPPVGERRKRTQNEKNGCNYFKWFDVEDGTEWQKMALIEARDEIQEKSRVIEQLNQTIAELTINLERIQQEEEIVRDFQNLYV
uniref:No apical meristem-associated C-terminal domain-containing protein n=1 Tax=Brassica oleracea TaxID=3712 RepID=A0A3P6CZR1_BRAOL|nr:unnamed protein product [Brassica oleracea]